MELEVPVESNSTYSINNYGTMDHYSQATLVQAERFVDPGVILDKQRIHRIPRMMKVAIVGESTGGKTCVCEGLCSPNHGFSNKYNMTPGVQIYGKSLVSEDVTEGNKGHVPERVNVILLDSSGKDVYVDLLPKYWEKLDGLILAVDLSSPNSLPNSIPWFELAKGSLSPSLLAHDQGFGVLLGTKTDNRRISQEDAKDFAQGIGLEYFECSARDGTGIVEPFMFLVKRWVKNSGESGDVGTGRSLFNREKAK